MHLAGAADALAVGAVSPMRELATVQTSLSVARWDEDQTAWTLRRLGYGDTRPPMPADRGLTPAQFADVSVGPYSETREDNCNAVVQQGWVWLLGGIAGTTMSTKFSASNGRVGVGTSNGANTWGTTYLIGDTGSSSTTSYYQLVSGAPTITTSSGPATLVFSASFGTGVANFAWAEFGTDNGTTSGVYLNGLAGGFALFNRGISNQGTKASGQTWTATQTISFGYPDSSGVVGAVS